MDSVKRVPYGVSDFIDIVKRNQYYVDKTMYIPLLDTSQTACSLSVHAVSARVYC